YPDRFMHVGELNRMGAIIRKEGNIAFIVGVPALSGTQVRASDLRASAALVVAGLMAEGRTEISDIHHLDRGYVTMERKLAAVGARIERIERV
ncbi:UDP-N-acetylglucosamine 1-carboxyvinyltransferase, partial [bacterium]|nr:UDP-N-acetylglucosamine 1-carboxyvinyltransferase [bacterium]